jgi:preprotein translocase subunit SecB
MRFHESLTTEQDVNMSEQEQNPVFAIQRMYLKGLSLELPHAPAIFLESQQPTVEVQLDIGHSEVVEAIHEAVVTVTLTTKVSEKVAFLIEVSQAGIFEIRNVPAEQMDFLLNVVCANMVFPYLRANLADAVQRTGFPPIHLTEFNFEAIYQQRLEQAQQQSGSPSPLIVPGR